MVTIKYYTDVNEQPEIHQCDRVIDFLQRFETRDELLDLRFFENDILSHEIEQSGGEFLEINEGTVAIIHNSAIPRDPATLWYIAIAVIAAVAVVTLMPDVTLPDSGRDQQSGTNRLGESNNEPRINERIDDIFGTVTKHVPPLWQVPYRIGVNNQETEVLLCCVGRGRYDINPDQWYDGDTPVVNIPNAAVNIYEPYKNPNTDIPDTVIGYNIDQEIGVYRQSNDLNPSELQPPNALDNAGLKWKLSGSGGNAEITATFVPENFVFSDYYNVGDLITLNDFNYLKLIDTITLSPKNDVNNSVNYSSFEPPIDLGEEGTLQYEILAVNGQTLTLAIPFEASAEVINAWSEMTDYILPPFSARIVVGSVYDRYLISESIIVGEWVYLDTGGQIDVVVSESVFYNPLAGEFLENTVGPVFIPENATRAMLNFVSPNGFYKLLKNDELTILANISILITEIDSEGVETGQFQEVLRSYKTNEVSTTQPVFQTEVIDIPYTLCKISAQRVTNRDKRDDVSNVDVIEWRDVYTFEPVNVTDFGDVTLAHVIIPSNSTSRLVKQRKQNVTLTRKITQYLGNGNFGPAEN
jgi:hypothetical protein